MLLFAVALTAILGMLLPVFLVMRWWWMPAQAEAAAPHVGNAFSPLHAAHRPAADAAVMNPGAFTSFGDVLSFYLLGAGAWGEREALIFVSVIAVALIVSVKVLVDLIQV